MNHEHRLEFISEDNGISLWKCVDMIQVEYWRNGHEISYQTQYCQYREVQTEDNVAGG